MAHEHKLSIFRGLLTFQNNVQKIWGVLIFLSIVTTVEVALGIIKPSVLTDFYLFGILAKLPFFTSLTHSRFQHSLTIDDLYICH